MAATCGTNLSSAQIVSKHCIDHRRCPMIALVLALTVSASHYELSASPQFYFPLEGYHAAVAVRPDDLPLRLTLASFALQIPETGLGENHGKGWSHRHRAPAVVGADV